MKLLKNNIFLQLIAWPDFLGYFFLPYKNRTFQEIKKPQTIDN